MAGRESHAAVAARPEAWLDRRRRRDFGILRRAHLAARRSDAERHHPGEHPQSGSSRCAREKGNRRGVHVVAVHGAIRSGQARAYHRVSARGNLGLRHLLRSEPHGKRRARARCHGRLPESGGRYCRRRLLRSRRACGVCQIYETARQHHQSRAALYHLSRSAHRRSHGRRRAARVHVRRHPGIQKAAQRGRAHGAVLIRRVAIIAAAAAVLAAEAYVGMVLSRPNPEATPTASASATGTPSPIPSPSVRIPQASSVPALVRSPAPTITQATLAPTAEPALENTAAAATATPPQFGPRTPSTPMPPRPPQAPT